ncbi:hypothetical protein JW960_22970 [candidate division KSB1 bacterium]|nr:hypothetical protein [candidate division KSB1 bacterium]
MNTNCITYDRQAVVAMHAMLKKCKYILYFPPSKGKQAERMFRYVPDIRILQEHELRFNDSFTHFSKDK